MDQAAKFIDFFVHDILDYSILNEDDKKFQKHVTMFDIREAVAQIVEILENKIEMKKIQIKSYTLGFDDHYILTD